MQAHARRGGYTLIEVLVALLLLAVGALGAQAAMLSASAAAQQSQHLSAALRLASAAADAMRANSAALASGDGANPYLALDYDALADGSPAASADCSDGACDSAALAAADLAALRLATYKRLPLGRIRICRDGASWDAGAGALRWECDGSAAAPPVVKIGWRTQARQEGSAATGAAVMVALPVPLRSAIP